MATYTVELVPRNRRKRPGSTRRSGPCPICGPRTQYRAAAHNDCHDYLVNVDECMRDLRDGKYRQQ